MTDKLPSKADGLRAMREANYEANQSRGSASAQGRKLVPDPSIGKTRVNQENGTAVARSPRDTNPVAKATKAKPSGLDAKGPSKTPVIPADRVVSRLGAGRTAQDSLRSETAEAVAIQKRGRPKLDDPTKWSRATKYRRQKEKTK